MTKRIVFEEPTFTQRSGTRASQMRAYINELSKTPDKWAIYARNAKSATYFYHIAKDFPNIRIATRANVGSKTLRIYMMWESKPSKNIKKATQKVKPTATKKPIKKASKSR